MRHIHMKHYCWSVTMKQSPTHIWRVAACAPIHPQVLFQNGRSVEFMGRAQQCGNGPQADAFQGTVNTAVGREGDARPGALLRRLFVRDPAALENLWRAVSASQVRVVCMCIPAGEVGGDSVGAGRMRCEQINEHMRQVLVGRRHFEEPACGGRRHQTC